MYSKTTYSDSTTPPISAENLNNTEDQYSLSVVIGEVKMYCGTTAPTDFLICNGAELNKVSYAALYAVTSSKFGGNSGTFFLPDLRGKYVAGFSTNAGDYDTIGNTGGSSDVTLTSLPSHNHGISDYTGYGANDGIWNMTYTANQSTQTLSAGSGAAHENRPQSVVLNFIIRYR